MFFFLEFFDGVALRTLTAFLPLPFLISFFDSPTHYLPLTILSTSSLFYLLDPCSKGALLRLDRVFSSCCWLLLFLADVAAAPSQPFSRSFSYNKYYYLHFPRHSQFNFYRSKTEKFSLFSSVASFYVQVPLHGCYFAFSTFHPFPITTRLQQ